MGNKKGTTTTIAFFIIIISGISDAAGGSPFIWEGEDSTLQDIELIAGDRVFYPVSAKISSSGPEFKVLSLWVHPLFYKSDKVRLNQVVEVLRRPGRKTIRIEESFLRDFFLALDLSQRVPTSFEKGTASQSFSFMRSSDNFMLSSWGATINGVPFNTKKDIDRRISSYNGKEIVPYIEGNVIGESPTFPNQTGAKLLEFGSDVHKDIHSVAQPRRELSVERVKEQSKFSKWCDYILNILKPK